MLMQSADINSVDLNNVGVEEMKEVTKFESEPTDAA